MTAFIDNESLIPDIFISKAGQIYSALWHGYQTKKMVKIEKIWRQIQVVWYIFIFIFLGGWENRYRRSYDKVFDQSIYPHSLLPKQSLSSQHPITKENIKIQSALKISLPSVDVLSLNGSNMSFSIYESHKQVLLHGCATRLNSPLFMNDRRGSTHGNTMMADQAGKDSGEDDEEMVNCLIKNAVEKISHGA